MLVLSYNFSNYGESVMTRIVMSRWRLRGAGTCALTATVSLPE
jgi:hypothetical protein